MTFTLKSRCQDERIRHEALPQRMKRIENVTNRENAPLETSQGRPKGIRQTVGSAICVLRVIPQP